jgi:ribonuclease D
MGSVQEVIVTTPERLADCVAHLAKCEAIGLDTEFVGEETYHPQLCLVQVASPTHLFLIDPLSLEGLETFWPLLHDPARVVVVHAGREEVRLCRIASGSPPANLFDLQLAAGLVGLNYPIGHGPLVQQVLGARLEKGQTLTEWRRRPLTDEQVRYAFDDVRYLLRVHAKLHAKLSKLGRLEWAKEEMARLTAAAGPALPANEERWRKLKGVASLDRKRLAVVRALYGWREEEAAARNRPARTIIRDDLLAELARRNPARGKDLQVIRGLPHRDLDAIVEVIHQARQLPADELPAATEREQDPPQLALLGGLLIAVLGDACARMKLASSLVGSNNDVRALVRARLAKAPLPDDVALTGGWRGEHVLPDLLAVLEGRRAVRVAAVEKAAPFGYVE